jgi:hypothetical protein
MDPQERFELAAGLWEHARQVVPGWPSEADRADDLRDHIELKRRFDAVAHVFRR